MQKKKKKILQALLAVFLMATVIAVILFASGVFGSVGSSLPMFQMPAGIPAGDIIEERSDEFALLAQKDGLKLYLRSYDGNFFVETASGERWYASPENAADDSYATKVFKLELASSLIVSYYDIEAKQSVKKNTETVCVRKKTMSLYRIENGFRAEYYFKDAGITIPMEVTLGDGYLNVRVVNGEIKEEKPEEYLLTSIRLLPNFGCGSENDEGYAFVPDGSGALMYFGNGKGNLDPYKASVYGDNLSSSLVFRPTDSRSVSMPVFGLKVNNGAMLAVITCGDTNASVCAEANFYNSSCACAYAEYKLRFTDNYIMDSSALHAQTIPLLQDAAIEFPACEQRYYFLSGEDADYAGMADIYRDYLIRECGVEKQAEGPLLFMDYYASVKRTESVLGIPMDVRRSLSRLDEILETYEDIRQETNGKIGLRILSWSDDSLNGKNETMPDWVTGNSWKNWEKLAAAASENGDMAILANDIVRFSARGNGIVPTRDGAKALSHSPAFQYAFSLATRMEDKNRERVYLLHPALLRKSAQKLNDCLRTHEVPYLSPLTLASAHYGSYDEDNSAFAYQTMLAVTDALKMLGEEHRLVLEEPNAYALRYADCIMNVPSGSSGYTVMDETVPFVQMVYGGLVTYCGREINLSSDNRRAVLDAISTGSSLHYGLITGDAELLLETELSFLFSPSCDVWKEEITASANELYEARTETAFSRLVGFERLNGDVTVSHFENGCSICVNFGSVPYDWNGTAVAPLNWATGEE